MTEKEEKTSAKLLNPNGQEITEEEKLKQKLEKEALIIKDQQMKLQILKTALIDERKKSSEKDITINGMKDYISQLDQRVLDKDNEIIKLNKEIMEITNSISLDKDKKEESGNKTTLDVMSNIVGALSKNEEDTAPSVLLEMENKKLKHHIEDLKEENDKFAEERRGLQEKIRCLEENVRKKEEENREENNSKTETINSLEHQLQEYKISVNTLEKIIDSLKTDKLSLMDEVNKLQNKMKTSEEFYEKLKKENEVKDKLFSKWQDDIKRLTQQNMELMFQVNKMKFLDKGKNDEIKKQIFKCEMIAKPNNIKCDVSLGPLENNEYAMLLEQDKSNIVQILLMDIESVRLDKENKRLNFRVMKNQTLNDFSLVNEDLDVLYAIQNTYDEYYKIDMKIRNKIIYV